MDSSGRGKIIETKEGIKDIEKKKKKPGADRQGEVTS